MLSLTHRLFLWGIMEHLIVIPTYNEAQNIEKLIRQLFKLYPESSILLVDDSSPDGTKDIIFNLQKEFLKLHILVQDKKYGLSKAYSNGFKWGLEHGYDVFTSIDADFSHNPTYINQALSLIEQGYDLVCCSRYIEFKSSLNLLSFFANIYIRLLLGNDFKDWTGGFNTYTKNALLKINLDNIKSKGYIFQTEMKYKIVQQKCKTTEIPIIFEKRQKGKSKMTLKIMIEAFIFILYLKFHNK